MSAPQFQAAVQALYSPSTDPQTRHEADKWLTAFKKSPEAWAVAQQVRLPPSADPARPSAPPARRCQSFRRCTLSRLQVLQAPAGLDDALQAAQVLSWKCKKQLGQLAGAAAAQGALVEALAALLAQPGGTALATFSPLRRALCVALANLAIACTDWARPLEALGE